jgi:Ulp1 family protease
MIKKAPGKKRTQRKNESLNEFSLNNSSVRGQEALNEEMKSDGLLDSSSLNLFNEDQSMVFDSESQEEDNFDYESLPDKLTVLSEAIDPNYFLDCIEPGEYLNDEVINFFL